MKRAASSTRRRSLEAAESGHRSRSRPSRRDPVEIDDWTLVAPKRGRIQYKLAQPGEVLPAGGRVFTLLDLTDVT